MPVLVNCKESEKKQASYKFVNIIQKGSISPEELHSVEKQNKNRYRRASLVVEAAVVFPTFLFSIYIFWQCFLLLLVQLSVCKEVAEVTLTSTSLGYVERTSEEIEDLSWLYGMLIWRELLPEKRMEDVAVMVSKADNGKLQARISYYFLCETAILPMFRIPVVQRFCFLPYVGEYDKDRLAPEEKKEDMVYVTKYGTVYHTVKSCGYLSVEVIPVALSQISEKRNSYGKKYGACDVCKKEDNVLTVYVSAGGTKYHTAADCPTLKKLFEEKKREEVKLPPCSKCAEGEEKK